MNVEEIKRKYPDQWVLVKVAKKNELGQPTEGEIIAHSENRDEIYARMKDVKGHTYTLYTGKIPKKGYAVAF